MATLFADHVFEVIRQTFGKDARLCFEPNGGNLGDILISASCIAALDRSGMSWSMLAGRPLRSVDCDVIVYGGGGNLVPQYQGAAQFLDRASEAGKPVVILPHTIRGHVETILKLGRGLVFCREQKSFDFVSSEIMRAGRQRPAVYFAHDMAFSFPFDSYGMWAARDIGGSRPRVGTQPRILHAFRRDGESTGPTAAETLGQRNFDLSGCIPTAGSDRTAIMVQAGCFLTAIADYDVVYTDRLHVAIAAALLDKQVFMFDNHYGKNGDVFRGSIMGRYPKVQYSPSPAPDDLRH